MSDYRGKYMNLYPAFEAIEVLSKIVECEDADVFKAIQFIVRTKPNWNVYNAIAELSIGNKTSYPIASVLFSALIWLYKKYDEDVDKPFFPRCPICNQECEDIYTTKDDGTIIGCNCCLEERDAWEVLK